MREVLAQNINRLMEQRYQSSSNRPLALSKDAGVSLSSVQRTLSRETGASIDTVEAFARVFGLSAYQLLMPGWLGGIAAKGVSTLTSAHKPLFTGTRRRTRTAAPQRRRATSG
jgi:hypothetical protein